MCALLVLTVVIAWMCHSILQLSCLLMKGNYSCTFMTIHTRGLKIKVEEVVVVMTNSSWLDCLSLLYHIYFYVWSMPLAQNRDFLAWLLIQINLLHYQNFQKRQHPIDEYAHHDLWFLTLFFEFDRIWNKKIEKNVCC